MIKAIFFDVGYTLLHTAEPTSKVMRKVLRAHGHELPLSRIKAAMQLADVTHMQRYQSLRDDWAQPHTIRGMWQDYYRHVFDELGFVDEDQLLAQELIDWYGQPAAWHPFPEAREVVEQLHSHGFCLGAVSDWAPTLPRILQAHGFTRFLHFVLCSGNIGFAKPSVQFYRLAIERAGVRPDEALHVGDSYYADVRGARAAGITPVLIDRHGRVPRLDCAVIRDLRELEPLLASTSSSAG
ncbi:MAG: HAD-IA family hydrolase [Chloroflexi bacterium]|nr:HAD-IA family hydrolase [Chloroflexota bacterium]